MRRNPKWTAVLMMVVVWLPLLLLLVLQGRQWYVQHQAKERLERSSLHQLFVPLNDIVWEKPGKELRIGGKLFDVKTAIKKEGGLLVVGLYDEEEIAIENFLAQHQNGNSVLFQLLMATQLLVSPLGVIYFLFKTALHKRMYAACFSKSLLQTPRLILTPPPQA
jgi:hypothetical protein